MGLGRFRLQSGNQTETWFRST